MVTKEDFRLNSNNTVRHFKGGIYTIMAMGIKRYASTKEDGELAVLYTSHKDSNVWVRPYDMFVSPVDTDKYPDTHQTYRMEKIEDPSDEELIFKEGAIKMRHSGATKLIRTKTDEPDYYLWVGDRITHTEENVELSLVVSVETGEITYLNNTDFDKYFTVVNSN